MREHIPLIGGDVAMAIGGFVVLALLTVLYQEFVRKIPYIGPLIDLLILVPFIIISCGIILGAPIIAVLVILKGEEIFTGVLILFIYLMSASPVYHYTRSLIKKKWRER
jgi:hypothetical protein